MRALFLVPWPSEAASTRLRVEQYFPYLRAHGVEPILRSFMSPELYRMVYEPGKLTRKATLVALSSLRRARDFASATRADVVFIHREAFPFGTAAIERSIAALGVPTVFDFDDAIYLPDSSNANGFMRHLKRPSKVQKIVEASKAVVVGNQHLREYASRFNGQVVVLPTPVDTDVYRPRDRPAAEDLVIGWIGSGTTTRYLAELASPLGRLLAQHPNVRVEIIGGRSQQLEQLPRVAFRPWSLEGELADLHRFDIGLMPYPDTEWARGKCAFKAVLYMSVGIPSVCSAIGMAEEVVSNALNGYLVRSQDEWFEALNELVVNPEMRRSMGMAGREIAVQQFSLARYAPRMLRILQAVASGAAVHCDEQRAPATGLKVT